MTIIKTELEGAYILEPQVFGDNRGWFMESYNEQKLREAGIDVPVFIQDNHSYSAQKGIVRGLHCQLSPHAQTKLIRCTRGEIEDVIVSDGESELAVTGEGSSYIVSDGDVLDGSSVTVSAKSLNAGDSGISVLAIGGNGTVASPYIVTPGSSTRLEKAYVRNASWAICQGTNGNNWDTADWWGSAYVPDVS